MLLDTETACAVPAALFPLPSSVRAVCGRAALARERPNQTHFVSLPGLRTSPLFHAADELCGAQGNGTEITLAALSNHRPDLLAGVAGLMALAGLLAVVGIRILFRIRRLTASAMPPRGQFLSTRAPIVVAITCRWRMSCRDAVQSPTSTRPDRSCLSSDPRFLLQERSRWCMAPAPSNVDPKPPPGGRGRLS